MADLRRFAIFLAVLVGGVWAYTTVSAFHAAHTPSITILEEVKTMVSWWHDPEGNNRRVMKIEVYRRDYNSNAEWQEGIEFMSDAYPPIDPPAEGV